MRERELCSKRFHTETTTMRDSHENGHKIHGRKRLLRRILWRMDNAGKQQRHTEMVYELVAK